MPFRGSTKSDVQGWREREKVRERQREGESKEFVLSAHFDDDVDDDDEIRCNLPSNDESLSITKVKQ